MAVKKTDHMAQTPALMKGYGLARLHPIGVIRSKLKSRAQAPKQGSEGAPDAWLEVSPDTAPGLDGLAVGDDIIVNSGDTMLNS